MPRVLVDATFHAETEHAAIACVFEGGDPVAKVIQAENSQRAEIRALVMAFDAAANRGLKGEEVVFVCDCQPVVYSCNGEAKSADKNVNKYLKQARRALLRNPSWQLEWQPRNKVGPAHQLAELTYAAWQAGFRSAGYIEKLTKERKQRLRREAKRRRRIRRREERRHASRRAESAVAGAASCPDS